jgi:hypothetical protein
MKNQLAIQKVFTEFLKPRLDELEKNYSLHSSKIEKSFILIDQIKLIASNLLNQEDYSTNYTSNNDLSKSFISTSSKTNFSRSKIADNRQSSRGKTPFNSKTSGNMLDKSADKTLAKYRKSNIEVKVTNNFSKGKNQALLEKNKTTVSTRTLTTHKSSSNISTKGKTQEGGRFSPDKLKRSK